MGVSCLIRKSHVSRENLMCQENISYLIIFGPPPTRKSPVSCHMRKSHVSRENLMSYQFWVPTPKRKSNVSCLMRKSHVSRENLMSQENISYLIIFGPPHEKISCLLSHDKNLRSQEKISCLFSVL